MPFDLKTAKPAGTGGFDLGSARPAEPESPEDQSARYLEEQRQQRVAQARAGGAQAAQSFGRDLAMALPNAAAGAIRGAGSIGATALAPLDMLTDALAGKGVSLQSNRERRAKIDAGLREMGADTDSFAYGAGKLGGEILGTMGVGPALAGGARAAGASPALVNAISSSGMRTGAPAATTLGQRLGDLGVRSAGGAITGGASAGLVDPTTAATGAAIGAATPPATAAIGAAGRAVGRAISGSPVSPEVRDLAKRAAELGIDVPADRIANSRPLNAVAAGLNYVPFSGRQATEEAMQKQMNRALSKTFGQDSDNVTQALRKADAALGGEFDRVLQSNRVKVDPQFLNDLVQAEQTAMNELGRDQARIITNQINEIINKGATGEIDGQAAYNIKKTLDRIGRRNTPEAYYASDLRRSLMGALNRSMTPDDAAAFATTRQQYGNMLTLQKLAQNGAEGDVSIARIANMKNIGNKDLQELADIAAQFLKPREGAHGAAQRAAAGLGIGSFGGPAALAATVGGGRLANSMMNSQTAKDLLLQQLQMRYAPETIQAGYRAAPVLGSQ